MFDNIGNEEMKTNSKISNEVIGCHWVKKTCLDSDSKFRVWETLEYFNQGSPKRSAR